MKPLTRWVAVIAVACASLANAAPKTEAKSPSDPLPRRTFLGAKVAPLPLPKRMLLGLPDSTGLEIQSILSESPAEKAGLDVGDVIMMVDGEAIATPAGLAALTNHRKAGEAVTIAYRREGIPRTVKLKLTAAPREIGTARFDVVFGSVATSGGRLRTILTKPKSRGPHPALFLIQGIGTFTVERSPESIVGYAPIIEEFAANGFVTMRVDKPGCGDSEGGPLRDVDFDTQMDGFRQALAALRADPAVDPERILIFGHSMGGAWAPLLAEESPVRGIAVYGTVTKTWLEYALENTRRQQALAGATPAAIDSVVRKEAAGTHYICVEKMTPSEMLAAHPDLQAWVDSSFVEQTYYSGLHYRFLQQIAEKNLAAAWEAYPGYALAIWGKSDFISGKEDHALIAAIVEAHNAGHGEFVALQDADHAFCVAATPEESLAEWGQPGREANGAIVGLLREWAARVAGDGGGSGGSAREAAPR